jgi:poly(A) polymerase
MTTTTFTANELSTILLDDDIATSLTQKWPTIAAAVEELAALDMDQGGRNLHKDNVAHTIAVVAKMPATLRLRLTALFHDVGKPPTRRIDGGTVTFHGHETVGARLTADIMTRIGYSAELTAEVAKLVELSGVTKGSEQWTDAAVRRLDTEAGDLLDDLLTFAELDVTSRHAVNHEKVRTQVERLRNHIATVRERDTAAKRRPVVDGKAIMDRYQLPPGPQVGAMLRALRDADMWTGGSSSVEDAWKILDLVFAQHA